MALEKLEGDDISSTELVDAKGRRQEMAIINEPGLYSLILTSRKPEAKGFKRWVTHEVLPQAQKKERPVWCRPCVCGKC